MAVRKITCNTCHEMKYMRHFLEIELDSPMPRCKKCTGNSDKLNKQNGMKIEYKNRVCLKCNRPFLSANGYRLCDNCHDSNRNIS